jgi:hypothetical protein
MLREIGGCFIRELGTILDLKPSDAKLRVFDARGSVVVGFSVLILPRAETAHTAQRKRQAPPRLPLSFFEPLPHKSLRGLFPALAGPEIESPYFVRE